MSNDTSIPLRDAVEAVLAMKAVFPVEAYADEMRALRAAHEAHHYYVPPLHGYTQLVAERDELRAEAERLRSHSEKMLSAVLDCDPTPACMREDDQLEPPWETIRRMKEERDEARDRAFAFEQSMELLRQERDELRAEVERLRKDVMQAEADLDVTEKSNEELGSATKRLHKERDEARAEAERLRESLDPTDAERDVIQWLADVVGLSTDQECELAAKLQGLRFAARREGAREALERVLRDIVKRFDRILAEYAEPAEEPEREDADVLRELDHDMQQHEAETDPEAWRGKVEYTLRTIRRALGGAK